MQTSHACWRPARHTSGLLFVRCLLPIRVCVACLLALAIAASAVVLKGGRQVIVAVRRRVRRVVAVGLLGVQEVICRRRSPATSATSQERVSRTPHSGSNPLRKQLFILHATDGFNVLLACNLRQPLTLPDHCPLLCSIAVRVKKVPGDTLKPEP